MPSARTPKPSRPCSSPSSSSKATCRGRCAGASPRSPLTATSASSRRRRRAICCPTIEESIPDSGPGVLPGHRRRRCRVPRPVPRVHGARAQRASQCGRHRPRGPGLPPARGTRRRAPCRSRHYARAGEPRPDEAGALAPRTRTGAQMTVTQDIDIWTLGVNASVVVKVVLVLLIAVSFLSWMFIFQKWFAIRRARRQTEQFEREFWSGNELTALYQGAVTNRHTIGSLERVFEAGFREFAKLRGQRGGSDPSDMVNGARRAMRATFQREMDFLERHLAFLASTGSVSPYVGLFGTVWGIMHAFRSLANVQQATLAQVAPGIAEALVATAIGLFAAIPAVVAYNRYSHDVERLGNRFESFMEEFSNILHRQAVK